jgi:hypothetical protein
MVKKTSPSKHCRCSQRIERSGVARRVKVSGSLSESSDEVAWISSSSAALRTGCAYVRSKTMGESERRTARHNVFL